MHTTIISINFSFGQTINGRVAYHARIVVNSDQNPTDKDILMSDMPKKLRIKNGKDAVPINFLLFFDGKESFYAAEHDMMGTKTLGLLMNQTNLIGQSDKVYYNNIETGEKFFQGFWIKEVLVNMEDINWTLTQETKKIGDYLCYKATTVINSKQSEE